jgi:hypothetical protein
LIWYANNPIDIFNKSGRSQNKAEIGLKIALEEKYPENMTYWGLLGFLNPQFYKRK